MKKMYGGIFFASAAVYLLATKPLDIITFLAVTLCAVMAGLSSTKYSFLTIIGGAAMIASSLFLQTTMSVKCMDCLKADILIMAGVMCISIVSRDKFRKVSRVLSAVLALVLSITVILHTDITNESGVAAAQGHMGRYIKVAYNGSETTLDTAKTPVIMYSPTCGACDKAISKLIEVDPEGKTWVPVQAMGDDPEEGVKFLKSKGFNGSSFYANNGSVSSVPLMIKTEMKNDQEVTITTYDPEEMVKMIKGGTS